MIRCPVCDSEFPDGTKYCAFCGSPLKSEIKEQKSTDPNVQEMETDQKFKSKLEQHKSDKVGGKMDNRQKGMAAGSVALGILILAVYGFSKTSESEPDKQEIQSDLYNPSLENIKSEEVMQNEKIYDNEEDEKMNLSEVSKNDVTPIPDIDASDEKAVVLSGTLLARGTGWGVLLDESASFFADDLYGDTVYVESQMNVRIETQEELGAYEGHSVIVEGTITAYPESANVSITLLKIETTDGVVNASTEEQIHRYEYIREDCTWEQALANCKARGGYLVRINNTEEYNYILDEIYAQGMEDVHFYIGGRRDPEGTEYYWVDDENRLYGERVDSSEYWCRNEWMLGEPSFRDEAMDIEEECLDIFYYKDIGRWVWNDVPNDVLSVMPTYSGKIGYICEYEGE